MRTWQGTYDVYLGFANWKYNALIFPCTLEYEYFGLDWYHVDNN